MHFIFFLSLSTSKSFSLFISIFYCPSTARLFHLCPFSSSLSFRSRSYIGCSGSLFDTLADWSVRSQRGALNSIENYFFPRRYVGADKLYFPHMPVPYKAGMFDPLFSTHVRFAFESTTENNQNFRKCSRPINSRVLIHD